MSNFIRQNVVSMANESLKVQQPLLESARKMNKLPCTTNTEHFPVTKTTMMERSFLLKNLSDGELQVK